MFKKHFILLLINICLCSSELTISPSKDIAINEGEKLEIICTASEAVDFIYPIHIEGVITRSEAKLSDERVNGLTKFTLKRSNLVFGDSGWYGCIEKSKYKPDAHLSKFDITPYNYDEANVKWIYVTVKSTQYWLHDIPFLRKNANGEYVLLKKEDDDVTLPCRSTSADYSVKLYNSIDNTPIDSFEYDPKKGITLKKIKNDSILQYNCLAEKKDGTKSEPKKFQIEIIENFLEKPEITSETLTLMEIGKNFSMECTGLVLNYETYFLDWTIPQTDRIIKDLKTYSVPAAENKELSYYQVTLQLTIKNVVKEDFGNYECRLYKSASVETAKINLTPHDKKHLKLSLKSPKSGEVIESGAQHTWTIDIDAYPLPKLHWFNPQKNEIFKPPKLRSFQVNNEKFSLDFTMTQFTVDDLGTHTIVAKSSDIEKTVTFDVLAQTPAKVMEVKQNEACLTKGATVFQCHAKGYPVPEISWNCVDKAGVVGDETGLKVVKTEAKEFEASSIVKVEKCPQGYVVCQAKNKHRLDAIQTRISNQAPAEGTVQSGSDGCPFVEKPKENVNIPDDQLLQKKTEVSLKIMKKEQDKKTYKLFEIVEFSCQASGNPKPVITWEYFNDKNALVQNGKITLEDAKGASDDTLVTSIAKIKILTPGYVICKAKNKLGEDSKEEKIDVEAPQVQISVASTLATVGKGPTDPVIESTTKKAEVPKVQNLTPLSNTPATVGKDPTNLGVEVTTKNAETSGPVSEKPDGKNKPAITELAKPKAKPEDVDPFSLGTNDQKMNVTKGDTVTMHCNASSSLFGDDIKWYNTSHVLATNGKVEINETKEASLHSSHLTIKDIQLWDKGDYSCEGTKRDGSAVRKLYHVYVNASAVFSASVILQLSIILLAYFM